MYESLFDLHSKIVRSRNFCELAGKDTVICGGRLDPMHIVRRDVRRLSFDPMNGICGCRKHHTYYTEHPEKFEEVLQNHFPARYEYCMRYKYGIFKFRKDMYTGVRKQLSRQLKDGKIEALIL